MPPVLCKLRFVLRLFESLIYLGYVHTSVFASALPQIILPLVICADHHLNLVARIIALSAGLCPLEMI